MVMARNIMGPKSLLKGAVSFRILQWLLNSMYKNLKFKADINLSFVVLRRYWWKVYNWLQNVMIKLPGALL